MSLSHVRIVGSGLIGTSIGLALVQRGVAVTMVDIDKRAEVLAQDLVKSSTSEVPDLILIATPINAVKRALESEKSTSVKLGFMDISSVKVKVKVDVQTVGISSAIFLPTHPMAGREIGGAESARADLFIARPWIMDSTGVNADLVRAGRELIELLGAHLVEMESGEHDQAVALVSHLPQIISSLLAQQLNGSPTSWLNLSGSGLRDTVRIAGSHPELWKEIIAANNKAIKPLLSKFISDAQNLLSLLDDEKAISEFIASGNEGKAQIPGKHGGKNREYSYLPIVIDDKPGQLAALFDECAIAKVNVEDLSIEHSPGQLTGLITLALSKEDSDTLTTHLREKGWNVHAARSTVQ